MSFGRRGLGGTPNVDRVWLAERGASSPSRDGPLGRRALPRAEAFALADDCLQAGASRLRGADVEAVPTTPSADGLIRRPSAWWRGEVAVAAAATSGQRTFFTRIARQRGHDGAPIPRRGPRYRARAAGDGCLIYTRRVSEWMRAIGWLSAGVALSIVTDGFGTFAPTESAPEAPGVSVPSTSSAERRDDDTAVGEPVPSAGPRPDAVSEPHPGCSEEAIGELKRQIGQLERLLTERHERERSAPSTPDDSSEVKANRDSARGPGVASLREDGLPEKNDVAAGAEGMRLDQQTQRQVMQIVQDLQRQIENGQLDRQRQIDRIINNAK